VRIYLRLLRYVRPHAGLLVLALLFMSGYAALSGLTVGLVVPFTRIILFQGGDLNSEYLLGKSPASDATGAAIAPAGTPEPATVPAGAAPRPSWGERIKSRGRAWLGAFLDTQDRLATLKRFCLLILLIFLLRNLFWYIQSYLVVHVEQRVIEDIRNSLYGRYLGQPLRFYDETGPGPLISRITNDVQLVRNAIANGFIYGIREALLAAAYLVAVLSANWRLFLITLLIAPPTLFLINRIGRRLRRYSTRSQERMADITGALQETIGGVRIIKAFNLEPVMETRYRKANRAFGSAVIRMTRTGALAPPIAEIFGGAVGVLILYVGGRDILRGTGMEGGQFLMFIVALFALMQPVRALSQVNLQIEEGIAASVRIFDIVDAPASAREPSGTVVLDEPVREVRYENVTFGYRPNLPVLSGISFAVHAGEMIAIVGTSGAGKSTLVDLLPRFADPQAGSIRLNGRDLREYDLRSLRECIGLVTQDTILFDDTVEANIAMGRPGAAREAVEAASRAANAHDFVMQLPEGYATRIGNRGLRLSGGERQRLAIARAILRDPQILIFDEATSALDSESEALVQEAIDRMVRHRTTFVIAHRLSTVLGADRILVLDEGRLVDAGTHAELLAREGVYRRLYEMQFRDRTKEIAARRDHDADLGDDCRA
jgi:subfamily B ATP-binding cassette protein MsbA